jgi:4-amino-4-deoxy-L-arabinose transferase-like glycosyltransferase
MRYRAALVCYFIGFAGLLAFLVPVLEAPDEFAHCRYISYVGGRWTIPNQYATPDWVEGEGHQPPLYYCLAAAALVFAKDDGLIGVSVARNRKHFGFGGPSDRVPMYRHAIIDPFPTPGDRWAFYSLRLFSVVLGVLNLLCVLRLSRRFIPEPGWALLPALFVATLPQFAAVSAAISNDPLANVLSSAALLVLFTLIDRPDGIWNYLLLGLFLGLGLLTKKTVFCLVPGTVLALACLAWMHGPLVALKGIAAALTAVTFSGWMFVRNRLLYGEWLGSQMEEATMRGLVSRRSVFSPYFVGQFPKDLDATVTAIAGRTWGPYVAPLFLALSLVTFGWLVVVAYRVARDRAGSFAQGAIVYLVVVLALAALFFVVFRGYQPGLFVWLFGASFVGVLGYLSVWLPAWVYRFYGAIGIVAAIGLCCRIRSRGTREDLKPLLALGFVVSSVAGVVYYNLTFPEPQGRFVFPALAPFAILVSIGLRELLLRVPRLPRLCIITLLVVGLIAADGATFLAVRSFFYDANQY